MLTVQDLSKVDQLLREQEKRLDGKFITKEDLKETEKKLVTKEDLKVALQKHKEELVMEIGEFVTQTLMPAVEEVIDEKLQPIKAVPIIAHELRKQNS